jgi:hypothetical protein
VIVIDLSGPRHDLRLHRLLLGDVAEMEPDELLHHELSALMEIRLIGWSDDRTTMLQLLDKDMITDRSDGVLRLTDKGRSMLVRGSPSLWDVAA